MSLNRTGQSFFFSVPKKWRKKFSFIAKSSSILHLDVYTQTLTHAHSQSHAPSIVIRGQNMIVMFSTIASLRMSFILFHGGERRAKEFKKRKVNQKQKH